MAHWYQRRDHSSCWRDSGHVCLFEATCHTFNHPLFIPPLRVNVLAACTSCHGQHHTSHTPDPALTASDTLDTYRPSNGSRWVREQLPGAVAADDLLPAGDLLLSRGLRILKELPAVLWSDTGNRLHLNVTDPSGKEKRLHLCIDGRTSRAEIVAPTRGTFRARILNELADGFRRHVAGCTMVDFGLDTGAPVPTARSQIMSNRDLSTVRHLVTGTASCHRVLAW